MIEERRQHRGKQLEDPDDEKAHDDPLPYLLGQSGLYDLAEAKTEGCNDKGDDDCRPNHEALAKGSFVSH